MYRIFIFSLFMAGAIAAFSQEPIEVAVWAHGAPNSNEITTPEAPMENGRVGNISQPVMYVYLPQGGAPAAAVIICPGGGYTRLAMIHEGHDFAKWLTANGVAGIVLKYRMPNGHSEVPLSDAQQALRLVRQHSKEWNIAPNKVGIAGFSAGGHLASTAATHFTDSLTRPDFAALFYPVVSMDESIVHSGSRKLLLGDNPAQELVDAYSNERQVTPQTPPVILFLSDDDKTVPPQNSAAFYAALKRHNVPAAMYIFPTGGHGWGMRSTFAYHNSWTALLTTWLHTNF